MANSFWRFMDEVFQLLTAIEDGETGYRRTAGQ